VNIVIDSNIVFSALLNTSGSIGDLLFNSEDQFSFYAPHNLHYEIEVHWKKLLKISKLTEEELHESQFRICKRIRFIDESLISERIWKNSESLLRDIDPDDIAFVALAKHLRAMLWSGDKILIRGLKKNGFTKIISTSELLNFR
jgi:predicted nucleic acid-binding protein